MNYEAYLDELVDYAKSKEAQYWLDLARQFEIAERRRRELEK